MAVTDNGTLYDDHNPSPSYATIGSGQGASADLDQFLTDSQASGRKADNVTNFGFWMTRASAADMSAAKTYMLYWFWSVSPSLLTKLQLRLGDSTSNYRAHGGLEVLFSDLGGWTPIWVGVDTGKTIGTVSTGGSGVVGTPTLSAIDVTAIMVDMGDISSNLKNIHIDQQRFSQRPALTLDGTSQGLDDIVSADNTNRYGTLLLVNGQYVCPASFQLGTSGTALTGNDDGAQIVFPVNPAIAEGEEWLGIDLDLQNASTDYSLKNGSISSGDPTAPIEQRPTIKVVAGSTGAIDVTGRAFTGIARIGFNSGITADDIAVAITDRILLSAAPVTAASFVSSGQIDPTNLDYSGAMALDGTGDWLTRQSNASFSRAMSNPETTFIGYCNFADMTPGAINTFFDWRETSGERFMVRLLTGGTMELEARDSADTAVLLASNSMSAVIADGEGFWFKVEYDETVGADWFYSKDPVETPAQDVNWTANGTPTGTKTIGTINGPIRIGATVSGSNPMTGDVMYASLWDGLVSDGLQVFEADWRTGADFTGSPGTRADGIQTWSWEEVGDPVYTQGDNNSTASDMDGCSISECSSYAAISWNVNTDPNGELDNITFIKGAGTTHAIVLGKNCPSTITLTGHSYTGYDATTGTNSVAESGAADAVIYNNSGKAITINIGGGGDSPSVRNGVGATTTVVVSADYTLTNIKQNTEVTILDYDVALLDITGTATAIAFGDAASTERLGQSFQVGTAGKCERVRLRIRKVGAPTDDLTVRLVNGVPGSTLLAESLGLNGADITTSFVEYDIDLTEKNQLSLATTYGIEIQRSGGTDAVNYYEIEYDTGNPHTSGVRYVYNAGWGSSTGDILVAIMEAASDNELFHDEDVDTGSITWTHDGTARTVEVILMSLNEKQLVFLDTVSAADKTSPVVQIPDLVYDNP